MRFQHTAARRRLEYALITHQINAFVSTHSRPKAAGYGRLVQFQTTYRFNTQPPEGGWLRVWRQSGGNSRFNTQPPEGGWVCTNPPKYTPSRFNTQPPEGGWLFSSKNEDKHSIVSTHSRPKAAGSMSAYGPTDSVVSTHSRPKAAGGVNMTSYFVVQGFNTQPPEGGWVHIRFAKRFSRPFQHTAARRRLG